MQNINIILTMGALPTLYGMLIALKSQDLTYLWYEPDKLFKPVNLPDNITLIDEPGNYYEKNILRKTKEIIRNINPKTVLFTFYTDDLRVQLYINLFTQQGIENYRVIMLSDGIGSYLIFSRLYKYSYKKWQKNKKKWKNIITTAEVSENNYWYLHKYMYFAPFADTRVEYKLQHPELLFTYNTNIRNDIQKAIQESKITHFSILSELFLLSREQQNIFFLMAQLSKPLIEKYTGKTSQNKVYKPVLIFTGTDFFDERFSFNKAVRFISKNYGKEYQVIYKPHPAWHPYQNHFLRQCKRTDLLARYKIQVFEENVNTEFLLFLFPQFFYGGYFSSLYFSVPKEKIIFWILLNGKLFNTKSRGLQKRIKQLLSKNIKIKNYLCIRPYRGWKEFTRILIYTFLTNFFLYVKILLRKVGLFDIVKTIFFKLKEKFLICKKK